MKREMKLYKLTDQNMRTYGGFQYELNKKVSIPKSKQAAELCTDGVLHAYKNINLAFLLNPIHASIQNPRLFEFDGKPAVEDFGKVGVFEINLKKELSVPKWIGSDNENKIRCLFAILCAESVLNVWASKYPNNNRPKKAIEAAKKYLKNPNTKTADAAADAAAYAADDAAYATRAAAAAAYAAAYAARAAAYAARAAAYAADDAAYAADDAAYATRAAADDAAYATRAADIPIDFGNLADQAVDTYTKG